MGEAICFLSAMDSSKTDSLSLKQETYTGLKYNRKMSSIHELIKWESGGGGQMAKLEAFARMHEFDDVDDHDPDHGTPLYYAASLNLPQVVELLIQNGANINGSSFEHGNTSLCIAAMCSHLHVMRVLLNHGAEVNPDTYDSPLILAACNSDVEGLAMLLDAGAYIDAVDADGRTALWWAQYSGRGDNARFLVERGADTTLDYKKENELCYCDVLVSGKCRDCISREHALVDKTT